MKKAKSIISGVLAAVLLAGTAVGNVVAFTTLDGLATSYFGTVGGAGSSAAADSVFYEREYATADDLYTAETDLATQMAQEGVVLLKNDGLLPLGKGGTVSLFGTAAVNLITGGSGSGAGTTELNIDFKTALNAAGIEVNETLWDFYKNAVSGDYGLGAGSIMYGQSFDWSINEVPASALQAQTGLEDTYTGTTAVYVFSRTGGEDGDLPRDMVAYGGKSGQHYLELDETERGMLEYLNEKFDNVIVIANTNNAFELGFVEEYDHIKAVLFAPGLGRMGAYGLANVLSGYDGDTEISPSGHLVDTFAYDVFSSPAMQNMGDYRYGDSGYFYVSYSEGIYVGYRYYETRYEDAMLGTENTGEYDYTATVQYPFGYGLSYTTFDWSDFTLTQPDENGNMTASVTVTNTGSRNGKEVVQLYFQSPYTEYDQANGIEKASVELVSFGKTALLAPGESETLEMTLNLEDFRTYDENGAKTYILDAGTYYITAAQNAHTAVNNILAAKGIETDGDADFVDTYTQAAQDTESYAVDSTSGNAITNRFEDAKLADVTYLTRRNWTMMDNDGLRYGTASSYESPMEQNGVAFTHDADNDLLAKLGSKDALAEDTAVTSLPAREEENGLEIIDLRGVDYNDPTWDKLVSELNLDEMRRIVYVNGYSALGAVTSINKPASNENDGPAGITDLQNHKNITTDGDKTTMAWATEVLIAQSFNKDFATQLGRMIGEEALIINNAGWYAPAVNLHRTPFAGRNFEYFSEDPCISGIMAHEIVNAAAQKGVICYTKHFALNDQETHRSGVATWSNEQAIRELYLEPFERTFKNNVITIRYNDYETGESKEKEINAALALMTSYNRIGATWAGGNAHLLTDVLRGEWGFDGLVLTDYNGGQEHMDTAQMLQAGGDIKLRTLDSGFTTSDLKKNPVLANKAAEAAHHYLYAQAHSLVMNGLSHGADTSSGFPIYRIMLIVLDIVVAGIVFLLIRGIFKRKKQ